MPDSPKIFTNKIPGLLAFFLILVLPFQARAQETVLEITDIQLSNHTGNAFVVSWRTNRPTTENQLIYGKDKFNPESVVNSSIEGPSQVHYAQVIFLDINVAYFYKVRSDGLEKSVSPTGIDSVITGEQVQPGWSTNLIGNVIDQITGDPMENVLVRSFYKWFRNVGDTVKYDSTMWFAVLTNQEGNFNFDIANYRTYENGILGLPEYIPSQTWLFLEILSASQGIERDSVLLTVVRTPGNFQDLGTYEIIDIAKKASRGIINASSPVLSNGTSASVVQVTVLDELDQPVPNVELQLRATPDRGVKYLQPQQPTDVNGQTWGLLFSEVAETKTVRAINVSSPDSTELDTFALVSFLSAATADYTLDNTPPFIYFTTEHPNTQNVAGPYRITSSVVDNFMVRVKLIWTTKSSIFADTVEMTNTLGTNDYTGDIPGQPFNSVVQYLVIAEDSMGLKSSKPDSIHVNPFIPAYRFDVLSDTAVAAPKMGITLTTDALSTLNSNLPVRIHTWITSTMGVKSAVIKWRNLLKGLTFFDVPMQHYGAHYWGELQSQPLGSSIEYFIQVTDSLGQVEKDGRLAPNYGLYNYEILTLASLGTVSFADTTNILGTSDVRKSRFASLADLNNDGVIDVVVANYGEPNNIYHYNHVLGLEDKTFESFVGIQQPDNSTCVAVADFNADDNLDIVFANDGGQNRLFMNNGHGRFEDVSLKLFAPTGMTYLPEGEWGSRCVVANDFNGDGAIDLFFANSSVTGGEKNRLFYNDSLGVFCDVTDLKMISHPADQSVWAVAGDLNGDGATDIVIINRAQDHAWLRNHGAGVFQYNQLTSESAAQATGGDLADVDGDGDLDLVVAQNETQQNELFLNNGNGGFAKDTEGRLPPESSNTVGVKFFDANADGYIDLYYINYGEPNPLLLNNGQGFFYEAPAGMIPAWSSTSRALAVTDFNQDNRVDLYLCEESWRNTLIHSRYFSPDDGARPSEFDLVAPAGGDTINTPTTTFIWGSSTSTDSTDILCYEFWLSLDSLFTINNIISQIPDLSDTTVTVPNLTDNTRYWWKVLVRGKSGFTVSSRQTNGFLLLESHQGQGPEFMVLVSRNPVFIGHITFYIISSETLRADPTVKVNLENVPVTRVGQNDIWRAQYTTRSSFLLTVTGENAAGRLGEFTNAYSSVLASAGLGFVLSTPEGKAWLSVDAASAGGGLLVLAQANQPVHNEKIKAKLARLSGLAGIQPENLEALLEGESYTFSAIQGSLQGSALISIKASGKEPDQGLAVCLLKSAQWQPLQTYFDPATGTYSARTGQLGTFALRPTGAGSAVLPKAGSFWLAQNSPNPFNPTTFITYSVPGPDPVTRLTIKIYSLRGQLVRTLVDCSRQPGTYAVQWNGRSDDGKDLPSGVYFYRMNAPGTSITRKMVLLR